MTTLLPVRYACHRCSTDGIPPESVCVAFEAVDPTNNMDTSLCFCGHAYAAHAATDPRPPTAPLPPKGGCASSGCHSFRAADPANPATPQSFCECGRGWLAHAKVPTQSPVIRSSPLITSAASGSGSIHNTASGSAQPAASWTPPTSARRGSSTNDRRVNSFSSHRTAGIPVSASPFSAHSASAHRSNTPALRRGSRAIRVPSIRASAGGGASPAENFRCRIVFIPYQVSLVSEFDDEEEFPKQMRLDRNKLPDLLSTLRLHHLVFDFSYPSSEGDTQLLEPLNHCILSHLSSHGIDFTSPLPSSSTEDFVYEKASWALLELGRRSRDGITSLLKMSRVTTWNITVSGVSTLLEQSSRVMMNPESPTPHLLYIAPRFGKLKGPVEGLAGIHTCFSSRIMEAFLPPVPQSEMRSAPICFSACQTAPLANMDAAGAGDQLADDDIDVLLNQPLSLPTLFEPANLASSSSTANSSSSSSLSGFHPEALASSSHSVLGLTIEGSHQPLSISTRGPSTSHAVSSLSRATRPSNARQPGYFEERHPSHSSVANWASYVEGLVEDPRHRAARWRAEAHTVRDLSQLLSSFILSKLLDEPFDTASVAHGAEIGPPFPTDSNLVLLSLFKRNRMYQVGEGVGEGVERAVLTDVIKTAVSDMSIWMDTTDGFKSISVLSFSNAMQPKVESKIRMQGFLCALHIYVLGQPPFPCSPFLLLWSIGTPDLLFDLNLVKLLAPEIGKMLADVNAGDNGIILDASPTGTFATLLATYLFMQPSQLPAELSPIQCMDLKLQLYASALLGPGARHALSEHPTVPRELQLFKEGFDTCIDVIVPSFASTLKPSAKTLITEMYQRKMKSPDDLISRLKYQDPDDLALIGSSAVDPDLITSFILQFSRYLRGTGHPDHPRIRAIISEEELLAEEANPMLRCELFLHQVSGSYFLPAEHQDIHVEFAKTLPSRHEHLRPHGAPDDWMPYMLPMQFQTCSHRMTVPFSQSLVAWLKQPYLEHDDSIATEFDAWVHGLLLEFSETFNAL